MFVWYYKGQELWIGTERTNVDENYLKKENIEFDVEENEIFFVAYTENFILNDFTQDDVLKLFEEERKKIINVIIKNIKEKANVLKK